MGDENKEKLTREELKGIMQDAIAPVLEEKFNERIVNVLKPVEGRMDEQQKEMRNILQLLRDAYNRDSRIKPFKDETAVSKNSLDYVNEVWRPMMKQGGAIDKARVMEIVQKTDTVSLEGEDTQGGSIVGPS